MESQILHFLFHILKLIISSIPFHYIFLSPFLSFVYSLSPLYSSSTSLYCRLLVYGIHSLLSIKGGSRGLTHGLNKNILNLECFRIDQMIFSSVLSFVGFWNTTHTWEQWYSFGIKWLYWTLDCSYSPFNILVFFNSLLLSKSLPLIVIHSLSLFKPKFDQTREYIYCHSWDHIRLPLW